MPMLIFLTDWTGGFGEDCVGVVNLFETAGMDLIDWLIAFTFFTIMWGSGLI